MPDLLEAAEYFQIAGLKEMCGRELIHTITTHHCLQLLDTAFKYDIKNLKNPCNEFFVTNKKEVLGKVTDMEEIVSNISVVGIELLGIKLEKDKF